MSVHRVAAHSLVGRNLALASRQRGYRLLTAGCSACYLNLAKTDAQMREDSRLAGTVNAALAAGGLEYRPGSLKVRHLLDLVCHDIGYEASRPSGEALHGLKVAAYYGCRWCARTTTAAGTATNTHRAGQAAPDPRRRAGGVVAEDQCCGGHMTVIGPEVAFGLIAA